MENYQFLRLVYGWFKLNKRDLPWRQTRDPYKIWVSEIILQQTRVAQGTGYYNRFVERFPNIQSLALAPEGEVLKMWQGLGYYSRARNLQSAAKTIVEKYSGKFPDSYNNIIALKGIGEYTAAAIASIAFNQPYAAVDGNVIRFISRYFEIGLPGSGNSIKAVKQIADEILDTQNPGNHNQALMELGATICLPVAPACNLCPVAETCLAYLHNTVDVLPAKKKAVAQKSRYFYYFLIEENNSIYLQQRLADDIWKNLFELPLIEKAENLPVEKILGSDEFTNLLGKSEITIRSIDGPVKHILSHQKIIAYFINLQKTPAQQIAKPYFKVNKKDIYRFAVSRLIEGYLIKSGLMKD